MKTATTNSTANKKVRTGFLIAGVLTGALAIGTAALAGPGGGPKGWGHGGMPGLALMHVMERLDLTDQQELQLIKVRKNLHEQGKEARIEMAADVSQVLDEIEKPAPNAQKIHSIADQTIQRFSKIVHSGIDQVLAFHQTLSAEQRDTLVKEAREAQDRMRAMHDGGDKFRKLDKQNRLQKQ
jgi:Spy/CpxP family protein refolding chaperone